MQLLNTIKHLDHKIEKIQQSKNMIEQELKIPITLYYSLVSKINDVLKKGRLCDDKKESIEFIINGLKNTLNLYEQRLNNYEKKYKN